MSGVSYPNSPDPMAAAEAAQAFGSWRRDQVGVVVAWPSRGTWADFTQVNSFYTTWAQQPYTKSFGIPLFPENVGATVGACIAGSYDDQWRTFADTMNSTGLAAQGTIIRLGWEFNQTTEWGSPSQFAACFRQIQRTVSAIAPGLVWDWDVNRGTSSQMPGDSVLSAYPGNSYVNLIGVDSYDDFAARPTRARAGRCSSTARARLNFWLNFAKAHGKLFSVPEWGVASDGLWPGHEGGDDPAYIKGYVRLLCRGWDPDLVKMMFERRGTWMYDPIQVAVCQQSTRGCGGETGQA